MRTLQRLNLCVSLLALLWATHGYAETTLDGGANLIPAPFAIRPAVGAFTPTPATRIEYGSAAGEAAARYLADLLARTSSLRLTVMRAQSGANTIVFRIKTQDEAAPEAYVLDVTPQRIEVSATTAAGLFYGAISTWQLLTANDAARVPAQYINDAPRFRWRGLMLDSARHYQSPAFIKRFIDAMAVHKLNVLHWHLTDDQAWRLEIKKYPRLTTVGAWRVPAGQAPAADIDPATQRPRLYGGFYSQADVREIVAYARARHITIVPEIEMPGHASAAIVAYPRLGVGGHSLTAVPADWGVYPNLYNVDDATFRFIEDVLSEVMALFPSEYIHIGGDEAVKDQWKSSSTVQARMRAFGVNDEHALQSYFVQRIGRFLSKHGRRLIGWDEILEGGLAPDATVMSWRGIDGAVAAAKAGHDTVLSPHPTLYFDNRPFPAPVPGRARTVSLADVYAFDPAPSELSEDQRRHVLGVQANVWTEHIRTEARVDYMTFPRAAALAEVAWSARERIDWHDFSRRLPAQLARYRRLSVGYAEPMDSPRTAARFASHDLQLCSEEIALSLEDDAPLQGERAVFLVDITNPCWKLPNVDLEEPSTIRVSVGQVPFNFQIGEDLHKVKLQPQRSPAGELDIRDRCDGELLASVSLESARQNVGVTKLPVVALPARGRATELCFRFTQAGVDPLWVLNSVELESPSE